MALGCHFLHVYYFRPGMNLTSWQLLRVIIPWNMSVFEKEKHCIF